MSTIQLIPLHQIRKNPFQQNVVDDVKVLEIAASLLQNRDNGNKGLLQVPPARQMADGTVELAFGHHRFYAFEQLAAQGDPFFSEMPLFIQDMNDLEMFRYMGQENLKRRDINPMEKANMLHAFMTTFAKTSVEAAAEFGLSEEDVRGTVRLLNLPEPAQKMVEEGKLTKTAARDLLVLEKIGGETLVEKGIQEIEEDEFSHPGESLAHVLRNSEKTRWLDKNEGWFSANKNFPRKHLSPLRDTDLERILTTEDGKKSQQYHEILTAILALVQSGMEVVDEAFPAITPDSLARLRVLANPTPCEKCPFHAVLDGDHFCGIPMCRDRKVEAWKKKELDDKINRLGVPLYQKSDGPFEKLNAYNDADKKLWAAGSPDLRLKESKYEWKNFDGVDDPELMVVVVGETYQKRAKKAETAKNNQQSENVSQELKLKISNTKIQFILRYGWEYVSHVFATAFDGLISAGILSEIAETYNNNPDLPGELDPDDLLEAAKGLKKPSEKLKELRRIAMFYMLDGTGNTFRGCYDEKNAVMVYAKKMQKVAEDWEIKLPKDFLDQAQKYQDELDAALKELAPAKKGKK